MGVFRNWRFLFFIRFWLIYITFQTIYNFEIGGGKILYLIDPYLFSLLIFLLLDFITNIGFQTIFKELLTLSLPGFTLWFFKVILGVYILSYSIFSLRIETLYKLTILNLCILSYFFYAYTFLPGFWWTSILCFPTGMIAARYKHIIENKCNDYCGNFILFSTLVMASVFLLFNNSNLELRIIYAILFSIISVFLIQFFPRNKHVETTLIYIGRNSLCFYLFQMIALRVGLIVTHGKLSYSLFVFLCTYILSFFFLQAKSNLKLR